MNFRFSIMLVLCSLVLNSYSARYYVNASATGNSNGLSWTNAMTDLQAALSIVIYGDEIWVAAGQYKPTTTADRTVSFELRDGVNIYGGFIGNETAIDQRDIASSPTTLNGDIGQVGSSSDNSYHVVFGENITTSIVLDGFRVINGNSNSRGGGLYLTDALGGPVFVRNCFFFSNDAYNYGGAIYLAAANLTIENCEFVSNTSDNGGAINNGNNNGGISSLTIRDSQFRGNSAYQGACLYNTLSYQDLLIDRCTFTNNNSDISIIDIDDFDSARLVNSYIIGNTVDGFSSEVLYINSFGSSGGDAQLINCTIANNYNVYVNTIQQEIIRLDETDYVVANCIIYGNTPYNGRQLRNGPIVSDCLIEGGYMNGTNIIDLDPMFVSPNTMASSAFDATSFDYRLMNSSPGINAGSNASIDTTLYPQDLALGMRIQGLAVDLGCYESSFSVSVDEATTSTTRPFYFDLENNTLVFSNLDGSLKMNYQIFDVSGKLAQAGIISSNKLSMTLKPGVYLAVVDGVAPLKFVVGPKR